MTEQEKVDEASRESMVASDPPAFAQPHPGGPARDRAAVPEDEPVRARAYELWEAAGRPEGRDKEFWERAQREVRGGKES